MPAEPLSIFPDLSLSGAALRFVTGPSSGPGGQNVNKVETRVTLLLDLEAAALDAEQRQRVRERLASRISREGFLRVVSQRHRTQAANRSAAVERLVELLRWALTPPAPRRPTRVPRAEKARRRDQKRRHSARKASRSARQDDL